MVSPALARRACPALIPVLARPFPGAVRLASVEGGGEELARDRRAPALDERTSGRGLAGEVFVSSVPAPDECARRGGAAPATPVTSKSEAASAETVAELDLLLLRVIFGGQAVACRTGIRPTISKRRAGAWGVAQDR